MQVQQVMRAGRVRGGGHAIGHKHHAIKLHAIMRIALPGIFGEAEAQRVADRHRHRRRRRSWGWNGRTNSRGYGKSHLAIAQQCRMIAGGDALDHDVFDVKVTVGCGRPPPQVVREGHGHGMGDMGVEETQLDGRAAAGMAGGDRAVEDLDTIHLDDGNGRAIPGFGAKDDRQCLIGGNWRHWYWCWYWHWHWHWHWHWRGRGRGQGCCHGARRRDRKGGVAVKIGRGGKGRVVGQHGTIGGGGLGRARHLGDAGQGGECELRIIALALGPARAVRPAARHGLCSDLCPGGVGRVDRRVADADQIARAIMWRETLRRMGEAADEKIRLPVQEGDRIGIALLGSGDGGGGEIILLPGRQRAINAIDTGQPAMGFALLRRPERYLGDQPGPVLLRDGGEIRLGRAAIGAGPGGLVDLPQAPGGTAHLVASHHQIMSSTASVGPLVDHVPGGLGLEVVENPARTGQHIGHIGHVGLVGAVQAPAGERVRLLGKASGIGVARRAGAAAGIGPEQRVMIGADPALMRRVPKVPRNTTGSLGLVEGIIGGSDILGDEPSCIGAGGEADIVAAAGAGHVLADAIIGQRGVPALCCDGGGLGIEHTGREAHALIVMRDGACGLKMRQILADIEPAMRCITQPLAAIAAIADEAAVPVLILALVHALLRHGLAIHGNGDGIGDAPTHRFHRTVIIELRLDIDAAIGEGGHVKNQALRAGKRDFHASLAGQRAGLPEGGRAMGQRVMQRGQHIDMGGHARGGDVDRKAMAGEGGVEVESRGRQCAGWSDG